MVGETKAGCEATRFNTEAERNKNNFQFVTKLSPVLLGTLFQDAQKELHESSR